MTFCTYISNNPNIGYVFLNIVVFTYFKIKTS